MNREVWSDIQDGIEAARIKRKYDNIFTRSLEKDRISDLREFAEDHAEDMSRIGYAVMEPATDAYGYRPHHTLVPMEPRQIGFMQALRRAVRDAITTREPTQDRPRPYQQITLDSAMENKVMTITTNFYGRWSERGKKNLWVDKVSPWFLIGVTLDAIPGPAWAATDSDPDENRIERSLAPWLERVPVTERLVTVDAKGALSYANAWLAVPDNHRLAQDKTATLVFGSFLDASHRKLTALYYLLMDQKQSSIGLEHDPMGERDTPGYTIRRTLAKRWQGKGALRLYLSEKLNTSGWYHALIVSRRFLQPEIGQPIIHIVPLHAEPDLVLLEYQLNRAFPYPFDRERLQELWKAGCQSSLISPLMGRGIRGWIIDTTSDKWMSLVVKLTGADTCRVEQVGRVEQDYGRIIVPDGTGIDEDQSSEDDD